MFNNMFFIYLSDFFYVFEGVGKIINDLLFIYFFWIILRCDGIDFIEFDFIDIKGWLIVLKNMKLIFV